MYQYIFDIVHFSPELKRRLQLSAKFHGLMLVDNETSIVYVGAMNKTAEELLFKLNILGMQAQPPPKQQAYTQVMQSSYSLGLVLSGLNS